MEKTLKISKETHYSFKKFCKDNALKMNVLVEKMILDYIKDKKKDE